MPRRSSPAVEAIDPADLAGFRAGLRRRYSDERILAELRECAERLGRSPTMREFEGDRRTPVHPQTVIERFGTWNAAKRRAGLVPRRFATRDELLARLRTLGEELGRVPTGADLERRREAFPSRSLYWHVFGSLRSALGEAGFDVPGPEQRLERAVEQGVRLARRLRRLPRFADWEKARRADPRLPSEWQVYRLVGGSRGAWARFQYLVRASLLGSGATVTPDGRVRVSARPRGRRAPPGASGRSAAPPGPAPRGGAAR